jgi:hypothetical protein
MSIIYDANKAIAEWSLDIPYIGETIVEAQKLTCDYIINPLVIGGDHIGCDAVSDVYEKHHGLSPTQNKSGEMAR